MEPYLLEKTIPTDIDLVLPLAHRISRTVQRLTRSEDLAFKTKLVLEEALTNAMRHGNRLDRRLKVTLKVRATAAGIRIDVRDQGKGFDPDRIPDPTAPRRVNQPSGRGVFLMRKLMDSVTYYDSGRRVVLKAHFRKKHA